MHHTHPSCPNGERGASTLGDNLDGDVMMSEGWEGEWCSETLGIEMLSSLLDWWKDDGDPRRDRGSLNPPSPGLQQQDTAEALQTQHSGVLPADSGRRGTKQGFIVLLYFTTGNIYFKLRKQLKIRKKPSLPETLFSLACSVLCVSGFPLGCTGHGGDREGGRQLFLAIHTCA